MRSRTFACGLVAMNLGAKAAAFLPPRVARLALDGFATVLFGRAERLEFTDTRGEDVRL